MSILHEVEAATPHPASNTALADKESKGQWWRFVLIAVISVIMIIPVGSDSDPVLQAWRHVDRHRLHV